MREVSRSRFSSSRKNPPITPSPHDRGLDGGLRLERAVSDGKLEVHGPGHLRRRLASWLQLNVFAQIRPASP